MIIYSIVSLFEEMKIDRNRPRNTFMSSLYSYLLPLVFFGATLVLSYNKASIYMVYAAGLVMVLLVSLPYILGLKKKVAELFIDLEMVN